MEQQAPLKFLIIEDDISLSLMFKKMLTQKGHTVTLELNVSHAFEMLLKESIDIVLIDLVLPGMDGSGIIKKMKEVNDHVFCVLISGYYNESFVNYKTLVGADIVLPKPITGEMMDDVVRQYHEKKSMVSDKKEK